VRMVSVMALRMVGERRLRRGREGRSCGGEGEREVGVEKRREEKRREEEVRARAKEKKNRLERIGVPVESCRLRFPSLFFNPGSSSRSLSRFSHLRRDDGRAGGDVGLLVWGRMREKRGEMRLRTNEERKKATAPSSTFCHPSSAPPFPDLAALQAALLDPNNQIPRRIHLLSIGGNEQNKADLDAVVGADIRRGNVGRRRGADDDDGRARYGGGGGAAARGRSRYRRGGGGTHGEGHRVLCLSREQSERAGRERAFEEKRIVKQS